MGGRGVGFAYRDRPDCGGAPFFPRGVRGVPPCHVLKILILLNLRLDIKPHVRLKIVRWKILLLPGGARPGSAPSLEQKGSLGGRDNSCGLRASLFAALSFP